MICGSASCLAINLLIRMEVKSTASFKLANRVRNDCREASVGQVHGPTNRLRRVDGAISVSLSLSKRILSTKKKSFSCRLLLESPEREQLIRTQKNR